ncbi:MAG: DedA family protein [Bacteriovoracaceae bacterium]|jgi:membrane-associated protein|nr:DedA family protein [Bacteriovoracaceae bacterium]
MEDILQYIQSHIAMAPWIVFFLLTSAGFQLPVSEDILIFTCGILAAKNPEYFWQFFLALYLGAYFSDLIAYWMGRMLGPRLWDIKFFAKMIPHEKFIKVGHYYEKYGVATLLLGRFIPFGVRNMLFVTAGIGKMNFTRFALTDFISCTISVSVMYSCVFYFGEIVIEYIKKWNIAIFSIAIVTVALIMIKKHQTNKL